MEPCPTCGDPEGEEACKAKRAAFHREPWLPNGFEIGAQWHSRDGGLTWHRGEAPEPPGTEMKGCMTVTGIDEETGTVTLVTAFKVPG